MKKLMIVAAVAAMVGGVKAADETSYVYDFSATLTTTVGKEGKAVTVTHYVGLGKNAAGKWWYQDDVFPEDSDGDGYRDFVVGGKTIIAKALKAGSKKYPWKLNTKVVKSDDDKAAIAKELGYVAYTPVEKDSRKVTGTTKYDVQQKYSGKLVWCEDFSYKVVTPGECYRDSGKVELEGIIDIEDWCDGGNLLEETGDEWEFQTEFFNFFGSQVEEKADQVEGLFFLGDDLDKYDGTNLGFALAGQGSYDSKLFKLSKTWAAVLDKNYIAGIKSISGNIVGYLPAPDCEACCADAVKAIVFPYCDDTEIEETPTAAFGKWSMKFNKKLSFSEYQ